MFVRPLSREEVRSIDRRAVEEFGLPTIVLMENAGRGASKLLEIECSLACRIVVACGPGNNGGDGAVVARHLDLLGYPIRVVWFTSKDKITGDAAVQHRILEAAEVDQEEWDGSIAREQLDRLFADADWIVDGLFGTGLSRPIEGVMHAAIEAMNASGKPIFALDLPSGLDADTGQPLGIAVRAAQTATFVAPKLGFEKAGALDYTGQVTVVGIGVPRKLLQAFSVRE